MDQPQRRTHPVHHPPITRPSQPIILMVTVCAQKRCPILAQPDSAPVILAAWQEAQAWLVGRYVIMPEHIHLFCAPGTDEAPAVDRWVAFWKSRASCNWPRPEEHPVWQRDGWDWQLRASENYDEKWEYVRYNPVRRGLVVRPEDWPYQGELNVLEW